MGTEEMPERAGVEPAQERFSFKPFVEMGNDLRRRMPSAAQAAAAGESACGLRFTLAERNVDRGSAAFQARRRCRCHGEEAAGQVQVR